MLFYVVVFLVCKRIGIPPKYHDCLSKAPLYLIVYLWQSSRNCTMWRHRSPQDNAVPFDNIFFPTRTIFKKKHLYSFLVKKGPLKQACIFYIYLNTLTRWVSSVQQMFHQNNLISWHSIEMITLHSFGIYLYPLIRQERNAYFINVTTGGFHFFFYRKWF